MIIYALFWCAATVCHQMPPVGPYGMTVNGGYIGLYESAAECEKVKSHMAVSGGGSAPFRCMSRKVETWQTSER